MFRNTLILIVIALGVPQPAVAQGFRLSGKLFRVTPEDSAGIADRFVVLHEVNDAGGRALDSVQTDRAGGYRFFVRAPDSTAEYFVSAEHDGIGYFSGVLRLFPGGRDSVPSMVVYDTAYSSPIVELHERHIIVRSEDDDGTRVIIELITLRNSGKQTRIAADTSDPVWEGTLPLNAFQLDVGQSDVGIGAVYARSGALAVAAPIPPGEKQILFSYAVPRGQHLLEFPIFPATGRITISLEDTTAAAVAQGLVFYGMEEVGGTVFKRYDGGMLPAGSSVQVEFERDFLTVARLQLLVVVGVFAVMAGTLVWWVRGNGGKRRA